MERGGRCRGHLLNELRARGFPPGAQRAYILAQVLERHPVVVVGALCPDEIAACHLTAFATIETALVWAQTHLGRPLRVALVPHTLTTVLTVG